MLHYGHVILDDGSILESDITIWAAGVAIPEAVTRWGLPQDRPGRIAVDDHLQVKGMPGVCAAGGVAAQDEALPPLAQPAIQTGAAVAKSIAADVKGKQRPTFTYTNLGTMATIGRHAAIAEIPFVGGLSGSLGRAAWLGVHITKMLGHRNQRAVAMNLVSLYGGTHVTRQPNPVVGEVDSLRAARLFEEQAPRRRFGLNAGAAVHGPTSEDGTGAADVAEPSKD